MPFFMPERNIVASAARQKPCVVRSSVVELVMPYRMSAAESPRDRTVRHSRRSQSGGTSARAPDTGAAAVSASARRTPDGMTAMRAARSM